MSGGVCLGGEGYVHLALPAADHSSYRTVLAHELTHACLAYLAIPTWINEALAMRMEQVIGGDPGFLLDQEVYDRHVAHWNEETIQDFWSGRSWKLDDEGFELCYNLAQVIWRKVETDLSAPRSALLRFISEAHFEDAGESAFREIFELGLGELIEDFLGAGDWAPKPETWSGWPSGDFHKTA